MNNADICDVRCEVLGSFSRIMILLRLVCQNFFLEIPVLMFKHINM